MYRTHLLLLLKIRIQRIFGTPHVFIYTEKTSLNSGVKHL